MNEVSQTSTFYSVINEIYTKNPHQNTNNQMSPEGGVIPIFHKLEKKFGTAQTVCKFSTHVS